MTATTSIYKVLAITFALALMPALNAYAAIGTPESPRHTGHDHSPVRGEIPYSPDMERAVRDADLHLIVVKHEGWRETLSSFARIKLNEITGRTRLRGQDPAYTILSMIFEGAEWYGAPIIPVGHPEVGQVLDVDHTVVSASEIIDNPNMANLIHRVEEARERKEELERLTQVTNAVEQVHRLGREDRVLRMFEHEGISAERVLELIDNPESMREMHRERRALRDVVNRERPFLQAGEKLLNGAYVLTNLRHQFLVVPDTESVDNSWVRPVAFGGEHGPGLIDSGKTFERTLARAFDERNTNLLASATQEFLNTAELSRFYPSRSFRVGQNFYVENNLWYVAAWLYLLSAALFGMYFFFEKPAWYWSAIGVMGTGFVVHTGVMVLRTYLRSYETDFRLPVSNMFESITFTAWAVLAIAGIWELVNRRAFIGVAATTLAFLFLTGAAMMPLHETRIQPLRAVLNSYWLNIHVTMMLLSYAAFALAAAFAFIYLVKSFLGREALFGKTPVMTMPQTEEFAYRLVQLGWPILTLGVALGAVWADHAWGRYWGWDPKETWAFITWVTYTIYLHTRMVLGWRGRMSAAACLIGFVMVLITWLGVSYLPWFAGGLHSYASPN